MSLIHSVATFLVISADPSEGEVW